MQNTEERENLVSILIEFNYSTKATHQDPLLHYITVVGGSRRGGAAIGHSSLVDRGDAMHNQLDS